MEHARRISKRQDNDWKCKTSSYILSSKQPAGFLIIPSLQWLLEKKVTRCIVTSINQCSYLPYIGMMMKSYFNKLVLDWYLAVNLSGYWESWVQNPHGRRSRFQLGGGCLARCWWKKSLFDSDTQLMITWRNRTHWREKLMWVSDNHAILSFNLCKSWSGNSWRLSILKLRLWMVQCRLWIWSKWKEA